MQPNGHVVVPFAGNGLQVFSSTDGGVSWGTRTTIAPFNVFQDNSGLRSSGLPLPSTGIDKSGKLYVVWSDCSFRAHCSTNDLVMSTSMDGTKWTAPGRIPIDPLTSKVNHLIPGLGVDRSTSGKTAHLTSTYYYFPDAGCQGNACLLSVGFTTSSDGGKTWTRGTQLAGPMQLTWLPSTFSGQMVADYLSSSYVNGQPFGVFMVAMGAGAVVGGLATAFWSRPSTRLLASIGLVFGVAILAVAGAPTQAWAIVLLVPLGAASISFVATNNATLQLRADPSMRGRVMSLNAMAFLGSTPIGAPLLGYLSDLTNPRLALAVGGVATLVASIPLFVLAGKTESVGNSPKLEAGRFS